MGASFSYPLTPRPGEDAWHPGIDSRLPLHLLRRCTIFLPDNAERSCDEVLALRDLCGLTFEELAVLKPERLVLHEVLVQLTADWSVADGPKVADLGISFRHMVDVLLAGYVAQVMPDLHRTIDDLRSRLDAILQAEWDVLHGGITAANEAAQGSSSRAGWWSRLFGKQRGEAGAEARSGRAAAGKGGRSRMTLDEVPDDDLALLAQLEARARLDPGSEMALARAALRKVLFGVHHRHGRLWGGRDVLISIARELALRELAPLQLGPPVARALAAGAEAEGYRRLSIQPRPMVMNTKGASASGKSTMRPLQQGLAARLGVPWGDFALISPDIWRKRLLDYASMERDHKYAGACTGHEVQIVDEKLDRYMARKAERGEMSHLLIDRFRFDSFAPDATEAGTNLLTRFGQDVYMFFMITPPAAIVERAWKRGLDVGRFKAIEDSLGHNVEAYTGIPPLFLRWAQRRDKLVHFEFLDNTVALGELPRTVAFGVNLRLVILDPRGFFDIEKFRRVNVHAGNPAELFPDPESVALGQCTGLLRECGQRFSEIILADQATGAVWLHFRAGQLRTPSLALLRSKLEQEFNRVAAEILFTSSAIETVVEQASQQTPAQAGSHVRELLSDISIHTLGSWNGASVSPHYTTESES